MHAESDRKVTDRAGSDLEKEETYMEEAKKLFLKGAATAAHQVEGNKIVFKTLFNKRFR